MVGDFGEHGMKILQKMGMGDCRGRRRDFIENEEGVAATEFALLTPVLVLILMGVIDFGMYFNERMQMENLARASVDYVLAGGNENNIMQNVIVPNLDDPEEEQSEIDMTIEDVCECDDGDTVSCSTGSCGSGDYKRRFFSVNLSRNYSTVFPYPGIPASMEISGHARMQRSD